MSPVGTKWAAALLAALAALFITDLVLNAQSSVPPPYVYQPPATTQTGVIASTPVPIQGSAQPVVTPGFNPYPPPPPGGFYPGYYGPSFMTPSYGYLSGASQVIGSQAQFMLSREQANQMQEQTKQTKLDTRRKTLEEWRYEQNLMPTAAELHAKQEKADLDRMRNNPPSVDIWSGEALNTLLRNIQKLQGPTGAGPTVMIDPNVLRKINVTDGNTFGQGMLKDGAKLTWPYALSFDFFQEGRKRMEQSMAQAVSESQSGKQIEPKVITALIAAENDLRASLQSHIKDLTTSQGIEARRYLNDLHESIRTLQDPNASNYVTGKWAPQGNTVAELVANMTRAGLKFAPSAPGNETAYSSLYQSMVGYDRMLASLVQR